MAVNFTDQYTLNCQECGRLMYVTYRVRMGIDPNTPRHWDRETHHLNYDSDNVEEEPCLSYYTICWRCMFGRGFFNEKRKAKYNLTTGEYYTPNGTLHMAGGRLVDEEKAAKEITEKEVSDLLFSY